MSLATAMFVADRPGPVAHSPAGDTMNEYIDTRLLVVKRIHAERRAEAAADRLAARLHSSPSARTDALRRGRFALQGWRERSRGCPGCRVAGPMARR
jgi:hypothetical protein